MTVVRRYVAERSAGRSGSGETDAWTFKVILLVRTPGDDEPEEIVAWKSDDEKAAPYPDVLDKYGSEGWELVSETVLATRPNPGYLGWLNYSVTEAIETQYRLKRPIR